MINLENLNLLQAAIKTKHLYTKTLLRIINHQNRGGLMKSYTKPSIKKESLFKIKGDVLYSTSGLCCSSPALSGCGVQGYPLYHNNPPVQ